MPDTPPPVTVWAEDVAPDRPPPRTDPPRHAHLQASEVFDRVAGGTRTRRRPLRPAWWGFLVGVGLVAVGGLVCWFQLDLGLMHVPTVTLVAAGLLVILKAVMGYR